jgi:hypothetical protein
MGVNVCVWGVRARVRIRKRLRGICRLQPTRHSTDAPSPVCSRCSPEFGASFFDGRFPAENLTYKQHGRMADGSMLCDGGKHYHVAAAVAQKLGLPATTECMKALHLVRVPYVAAPYDVDLL